MPIHKNIFGELISVQIHAAHVFTPGRIQENIPGELFMYWFRASSKNNNDKRKKKEKKIRINLQEMVICVFFKQTIKATKPP